jgi:4Fe-4S ferredoxin
MEKKTQAAGLFMPVININRCEGKGPCIAACPHDVLQMGVLANSQRTELTILGAVKAWAHHYRQAQVEFPERCLACADCVSVCPEKAITLLRRSSVER